MPSSRAATQNKHRIQSYFSFQVQQCNVFADLDLARSGRRDTAPQKQSEKMLSLTTGALAFAGSQSLLAQSRVNVVMDLECVPPLRPFDARLLRPSQWFLPFPGFAGLGAAPCGIRLRNA